MTEKRVVIKRQRRILSHKLFSDQMIIVTVWRYQRGNPKQ